MKCEQYERLWLLAQSGELSPRQWTQLRKHAAACPPCRATELERRRVLADSRRLLPKGNLAPAVMVRIRAASEETPRILWFRLAMGRMLACAAALILMVGGFFWLSPRRVHESALGDFQAVLALMAEEPPEGEATFRNESEALRSLADSLLRREGLSPDDPAWESSIPLAAPEPTTRRFRSSSAPDSTRYG